MPSERIAPLPIERLRALQDLARYGPDVVSMAQEIEALRALIAEAAKVVEVYTNHIDYPVPAAMYRRLAAAMPQEVA